MRRKFHFIEFESTSNPALHITLPIRSPVMKMADSDDSILQYKKRINWFPGHMPKALAKIKKKIGKVDLVLEVRDARVALSSGNRNLQKLLGNKPRLVILNKSNLADPENMALWKTWFRSQDQPFLYINSFDQRSLKQVTTKAKNLMEKKWETYRKKGIRPPPLRLMLLGIPNTGKSTIINRLAKRNAARTGDRPGVTQSQEWIVLDKDLELLDTPGIMPPKIDTYRQGLRLCAIHAIRDEIVGKERVAEFVVNFLQGKNWEEPLRKYPIESTDGEPSETICRIGRSLKHIKKGDRVDYAKTCGQILHDFRKGLLGRHSFESPPSR